MSPSVPCITVAGLDSILPSAAAPLRVDVRRKSDFVQAGRVIVGSLRRDAATVEHWGPALIGQRVLVYCAHGRSVSQGVCQRLVELGVDAAYLEGGYSAWAGATRPTARWREPLSERASRWVTRERPKIDRIACPWLIRRFLDPQAEFLYVPTAEVLRVAAETGATPYDIPDVQFSHRGPLCSFDAFLADFELSAPGLEALAIIVRGADTNRLDLAPEAAGLLAISLGLSANFANDHDMLVQGLVLYDALYAACRYARAEGHDWKPDALRVSLASAG